MKQPAFICDMDGCLALRGDRDPYNFELCTEDDVNFAVRRMLDAFWREVHILIVSGRQEKYRTQTERWLFWHNINYARLLMRATGDGRDDAIVKKEIYEREIAEHYDVLAVFDDRLRVCRMWHALGLPLFRVGDPDASF